MGWNSAVEVEVAAEHRQLAITGVGNGNTYWW